MLSCQISLSSRRINAWSVTYIHKNSKTGNYDYTNYTKAREDQGVRKVIPHIGPIPIIIPLKLFLDLPRDPVFPRRLSDSSVICHEFYPRGQLSRFPRNATRLS